VAQPLPDDWWTTRDVARFLHISSSTVRAYVTRGQMPKADRRIGREPVWRPATIREWHEQRPRRNTGQTAEPQ
jgi:predicted DNA-binding transcriptional regulator AlpA